MTIRQWDEAQAARAAGIERLALAALKTAEAAQLFGALEYNRGVMAIAEAAVAYADAWPLVQTPVPPLTKWQQILVWGRRQWRRLTELAA